MRVKLDSKARGRLIRTAVLVGGAVLLGGCATGYSFIQPSVAGGGSYYTSNGPYAAPDYYGYGGGYDASSPWAADPFGWYGWPLYGSSISFSFGFGNVWGWPGYAGLYGPFGGWPYYTGWGYPVGLGGYGFRGYYRHGHRHPVGHHDHGWHDRGGNDAVASDPSPRAWLKPDHPRIPPPRTRGGGPDRATAPPRALGEFATRRRLPSAGFAPQRFERAHIQRTSNPRLMDPPMQRAYVSPRPMEPALERAPMPMSAPRLAPRSFAPPAARDFSPPAAAVAAPAPAAARPARGNTPAARIR